MIDFSYRSYAELLAYIRSVGRPIGPLRQRRAEAGPQAFE